MATIAITEDLYDAVRTLRDKVRDAEKPAELDFTQEAMIVAFRFNQDEELREIETRGR